MAAAAGLALLLVAASVDVEGGATLEGRAGSGPIAAPLAGEAARPQSAAFAMVTPSAAVALNGHDGSLKLRYAPALSWVRVAGRSERDPYVLHFAELTGLWRSDHGVTWNLRAAGTSGDTDYTALTQVLGKTQGQIPSATGFTSGQAVASARIALDRRWQLELAAEGLHRETFQSSRGQAGTSPALRAVPPPVYPHCAPPLIAPMMMMMMHKALPPPAPLDPARPGRPPPAPASHAPPGLEAAAAFDFPTESTLTLAPDLSYALTRQDTVDLRAGAGYLWLSTGLQIAGATPQIGWRHNFRRQGSLRAVAGMTYTTVVSLPSTQSCVETAADRARLATTTGSSLHPVAELAATTELYGSRGFILTTAFTVGATYYFDPVTSSSGEIGTTGLQLAAALPPDWSVRIEASFSTSLRAHALPGNPDETVFTSSLPVRYRVSRNVSLELGGRWSDRAPHLSTPNVRFHQRELWIYGAMSGTFGTYHSPPRASGPAVQ